MSGSVDTPYLRHTEPNVHCLFDFGLAWLNGRGCPGMRRRGVRKRRTYGADADGMLADGTPASTRSSGRRGGLSSTAWRRKPMPDGWDGPGGTRELVLARDEWRCQIGLPDRCNGRAIAVDHIDPDGPEEMDNYQSVCGPCHAWKTGVEGAQGKAQKAARERAKSARDHPGYL